MSLFDRMRTEGVEEFLLQQRFTENGFLQLADGNSVSWPECDFLKTRMEDGGHFGSWLFHDSDVGLRMIVSIHNNSFGFPYGGIRFLPDPEEKDVLEEALNLSRAMTLKTAINDLGIGGGKIVVSSENGDKSERFLNKIGDILESFGGIVTGPDMGFSPAEYTSISEKTRYIACAGAGDRPVYPHTGNATAAGWMMAMETTAEWLSGEIGVWEQSSLSNYTFAVQGTGFAGREIIKRLTEKDASVVATDIETEKLSYIEEEFGVDPVSPDRIYNAESDVFVPAGPPETVNTETIPELTSDLVAPVANNALRDEKSDEHRLFENNIFYQPEVIANAGGVIQGIHEMNPENLDRSVEEVMKDVYQDLEVIPNTLTSVYEQSEASGVPPFETVRKQVRKRLSEKRQEKNVTRSYPKRG